ncbi:MAG: hypothetical protein ABIN00_08125 [candidate division WOR-3 bacterium]
MKERLTDLEQFLFSLQRLEGEGKNTQAIQEETWEEIKREIEEKVDKENERNSNRR